MKVKVSFGETTVVVPCGNGDQPVSMLFEKSVARYLKAIGKSSDLDVRISSLKTASENAILDPDDTICDVLDDNDLLVAVCDLLPSQNVYGDLSSGSNSNAPSSVPGSPSPLPMETPSPPPSGEHRPSSIHREHGSVRDSDVPVPNSRRPISITMPSSDESAETRPHCRYSDHRPEPPKTHAPTHLPIGQDILTSAALGSRTVMSWAQPSGPSPSTPSDSEMERPYDVVPQIPQPMQVSRRELPMSFRPPMKTFVGSPVDGSTGFSPLRRTTNYQSTTTPPRSLINRWERKESLRRPAHQAVVPEEQEETEADTERKGATEPDGASQQNESRLLNARRKSAITRTPSGHQILDFRIGKDGDTVLGIRIRGYRTSDNRDIGIFVRELINGSPAALDGQIKVADRIIKVNDMELASLPNDQAITVFQKAVKGPVSIQVSRAPIHADDNEQNSPVSSPSPPPVPPEDDIMQERRTFPAPIKIEKQSMFDSQLSLVPAHSVPSATREFGTVHEIDLLKQGGGLGFSITSRDVAVGDDLDRKVFVKAINTNGVAFRDGRLRIGDRLLEVNGVDMTGKSQAEAVDFLKKTSGQVVLKVWRQEAVSLTESTREESVSSPNLSQSAPSSHDQENSEKVRRIAISVPLTASSRAGFGISVRCRVVTGQTSSAKPMSCLYIKTVMAGGAAAKDGRLRANDCIVSIDDQDFTGLSDSDAMSCYRTVMQTDTNADHIDIVIDREIRTMKAVPTPLSQGNESKHRERAIEARLPRASLSEVEEKSRAPSSSSSNAVTPSVEHRQFPHSAQARRSFGTDIYSDDAAETDDAGPKPGRSPLTIKIQAGCGYQQTRSLLETLRTMHTQANGDEASSDSGTYSHDHSVSDASGGSNSPPVPRAGFSTRTIAARISGGKSKVKPPRTTTSGTHVVSPSAAMGSKQNEHSNQVPLQHRPSLPTMHIHSTTPDGGTQPESAFKDEMKLTANHPQSKVTNDRDIHVVAAPRIKPINRRVSPVPSNSLAFVTDDDRLESNTARPDSAPPIAAYRVGVPLDRRRPQSIAAPAGPPPASTPDPDEPDYQQRVLHEKLQPHELPKDVNDWSRLEVEYPIGATLPRLSRKKRAALQAARAAADNADAQLPGEHSPVQPRSRTTIYVKDPGLLLSSLSSTSNRASMVSTDSRLDDLDDLPMLSRSGPGRKSMSERGHTSLDPNNYKFFKDLKKHKKTAGKTSSDPANSHKRRGSEGFAIADRMGLFGSDNDLADMPQLRRAASLESMHMANLMQAQARAEPELVKQVSPKAIRILGIPQPSSREQTDLLVTDHPNGGMVRTASDDSLSRHKESQPRTSARRAATLPSPSPPPPTSNRLSFGKGTKMKKKLSSWGIFKTNKPQRRPRGMPATLPPLRAPQLSPPDDRTLVRSRSAETSNHNKLYQPGEMPLVATAKSYPATPTPPLPLDHDGVQSSGDEMQEEMDKNSPGLTSYNRLPEVQDTMTVIGFDDDPRSVM